MMKKRRRWPWLLILPLASGSAMLVARQTRASRTAPIEAARVATVQRGDLVVEIVDTGKVQPIERVELKSKVAGQVQRIYVREGDQVRRGALLIKLDPTDALRDEAKGRAEVAQAANALEFARLSLVRKERGLAERGIAEADVEVAENEVRARAAALRLARVGLAAARDRMRYHSIRSPIDGTVIVRSIQPGEVVTPGVQATFEGRPLLTVADLSTLVVKADLNQIDAAAVRVGQRATVTLDALPGRSYAATITKIAPASVRTKNNDVEQFPIEATLADADDRIRPGMTADLRILVERHRDVVLVPVEAVERDADGAHAQLLVEDERQRPTARPVAVTVGAHNDRFVEVRAGLSPGDKIVINDAEARH